MIVSRNYLREGVIVENGVTRAKEPMLNGAVISTEDQSLVTLKMLENTFDIGDIISNGKFSLAIQGIGRTAGDEVTILDCSIVQERGIVGFQERIKYLYPGTRYKKVGSASFEPDIEF